MHEIQGPARVDLGLDQDRRSCADGSAPRLAPADRQPFLPIKPVNAIDPRWLALVAQHHKQGLVAVPVVVPCSSELNKNFRDACAITR